MVTRRDFLKTMSMASAGLALGTGDLLHAQTVSPKKGRGDKVKIAYINPEKPDVPLNKNDAFQKVQKRRVQEKR